MNYITSTRRRIASADRLSMLEQYYTDKQNLDKRASISLASLLDEGYPDNQYRTICFDCASQIYHAYSEGRHLAGFSLNYGNKGYRWIGLTNINLLSYAPANDVSDASGNVYNPYMDDVAGCWNMFKYYGGRNDQLVNYEGVFDDRFAHQRIITELIKKYETVMKDMDISQDFWKNISKRAYYQVVVGDVDLHEYESEPEPSLPTVGDFRGLVNKTSDSSSALYYANILSGFDIKVQREPWMDLFNQANAKKITSKFYIHDEDYTLEFVNEIQNKIRGKQFYYQTDDTTCWVIASVDYLTVNIVDRKIKEEYREKYENASDKIKKEIYEMYPDFYFDNKYELLVEISVADRYISTTEEIVPMKLVEIPSGNAFCAIVKKYSDSLLEELSAAYGAFMSASEHTRCLEGEPATFYTNAMKIFRNANFNTVSSCENIIKFCKNQALSWMRERANNLYKQTTDDENAAKFIKALSKRLNKNTGSLMIWYHNIISIDQAVEDLEKERWLTRNTLKGLAVSACYINTRDDLSCNAYCPNYIDLKPLDSMYSYFEYSFNKGDKVYICDDTHTEFTANVINAEYIYIRKTSYENATLNQDGTVENANITADRVLRLTLDRKLPVYYCNGNDVSSLRCSKIC